MCARITQMGGMHSASSQQKAILLQKRHDTIWGRKKHINFCNINFLAPTQEPPFGGPRKKFMCLISWERTQKSDPGELFQGDLWGRKRGPKRAIFGHRKFSLLFFPALKQTGAVSRYFSTIS